MNNPIPKRSVEEAYEKNYATECITRQMTPEEYVKYFGEGEEDMARKNTSDYITSNKNPDCKVSKAELIELCKTHGAGYKGAEEIAQITGLSVTVIIKYIKAWGIEEVESEAPASSGIADKLIDDLEKTVSEPEKEQVACNEQPEPETKEFDPVTLKASEKGIVPRLHFTQYLVGTATLGIDFQKEIVYIGDSQGMTFEEAAAIVELLNEIL